MGGGGEPDGDKTIFDDGLVTISKFVNSSPQWQSKVSFNGGHKQTELILKNKFQLDQDKKSNFTPSSYKKLINEYKEKILFGEIKEGDQLMLMISTHGAKKTGNEKSHSISVGPANVTNLQTLEGSEVLSLDELESLIELADSRGVKLALLDFTCHSGSSLKLAKPSTCIISATGPDHFGYNSFADRFTNNLKKSKNLEEAYLKTFVDRNESSFPMISTKAGKELFEKYYALLSPYLYYSDDEIGTDKLRGLFEKDLEKKSCSISDESMMKLIGFADDLKRDLNRGFFFGPNFNSFKDKLKAYHQLLKETQDEIIKMTLPKKTEKISLCFSRAEIAQKYKVYLTDDKYCNTWSVSQMMMLDVDKEILRAENEHSSLSSDHKIWNEVYMKSLQSLKLKKADYLIKYPDLKNFDKIFSRVSKLQKESWEKSIEVSRGFQELYTQNYEKISKETASQPNPCRDFKL